MHARPRYTWYREWLDYNELELALDELACAGDENDTPPEF